MPQYLKFEFIGFVIAVFIYVIFMIWFLLHVLRNFHKKELLHDEQLLIAKYQAEKEQYLAQLEIQEETFIQVSQELHDNVGQFLSLAKLGLTTLNLKNLQEAELGIAEVTDIIEKSVSDLRDISRAMNADLVKKLGLKKAIESQVGFLRRAGNFHVQFECEGSIIESDPQKEVILYRILQESINNIIKHSRANEISIFLSSVKNTLKLLIQDNGDGFDANLAMAGYSSPGGITNMRGRADLINAEFSIESIIGQGTKVVVVTSI